MIKKIIFWTLSVIITLSMAVYQRLTGPTHPVKYQYELNGIQYKLSLPRSHNGTTDCEISLDIKDESVNGLIIYKRFKMNEPYDTISLTRKGENLVALLPGQPAAGKLEYKLQLTKDGNKFLWTDEPIVIRFKNNVPAFVLIPHILFIFAAMLLSTLAGFFAAGNIPSFRFYTGLTVILFLLGGMALGPVVQKYAFGEFWTGFPFGKDITDNKALIATLFWLAAWFGNLKKERKYLVILAALVNIAVGIIPHSAGGSELDYNTGEIKTGLMIFSGLL
jgi:hypothetical protein